MRRGRELALAAATALACLFAGEGAARWLHQRPWYDQLLDEQARAEGYVHEATREGLRGGFPREAKAAGERRILLLGDSVTFGMGVLDDADTFARRLEAQLGGEPGALPAGVTRVRVANAGQVGSLTGDWLATLREQAPRVDPDLVLAVFFLRDGTSMRLMRDFFGPIRDEIAARNRASWLYRHLALFRVFRDRSDRLAVSERYLARFERAYRGTREETAEWRRAQRNLARLATRARRAGAGFGLVIFPVLVELGAEHPFAAIGKAVADFAATRGIPSLDLLPAFRGQDAAALWVSAFDQHPNARAHAIAAHALAPFARALLRDAAGAAGAGATQPRARR